MGASINIASQKKNTTAAATKTFNKKEEAVLTKHAAADDTLSLYREAGNNISSFLSDARKTLYQLEPETIG